MPLEPLPKELQAAAIANALESSSSISRPSISILGYGVTTKPIVAFLNAMGKACAIYDDKPEGKRLDSSSGGDVENILLDSREFCAESSVLEILSPGIPPQHECFSQAQHSVSEYDFIWWLCKESACGLESPQIWISGTNGKTTTTQMLTHILAPFGALSGGNIGTPLITLYEQNAPLWILETSSFALHYTRTATPRIYALLPLSPDHISWHNGFAGYVDDKLSPLARMGVDSVAILPSALKDHRLCKEFAGEMVLYRDSSDLRAFLRAKGLDLGENDLPFFEPFLLDAYIALCCAFVLSRKCPSITASGFIPALARFTIGAHRMEEFYVRAFGAEWLFVDDSKGTNTDATLQAIARYKDCALFLILGGDDKGADCTEIFTLLQHIQKAQIFTIGSNEPKLLDLAARHSVKAHKCGTLDCAMEKIWAIIAGFMDSRSEAQSLESTFENATNAPTLSTIQPPQAQETCPSTAAKRKRFIPLPSPLTQKDKATAFSFCNQGGSLAFPLLALARRRDTTARLTPTLAHHEAGENQCEPSLAFKEIDSASAEFVCLLSPAAASLDQFSSYKERGERFKSLARSLATQSPQ